MVVVVGCVVWAEGGKEGIDAAAGMSGPDATGQRTYLYRFVLRVIGDCGGGGGVGGVCL